MSRNFELLRKVQGSAPLEQGRVDGEFPHASPVKYRTFPRDSESEIGVEPEWLRAMKVLKKHWRPAVLFAISVFLAVALITFLMKPMYEPVARLQIAPPGTEAFSMQGNNGPDTSTEYISTQAKNLQSEQLGLEVIRTLHLDRDPDFAGKLASNAENSDNRTPSDGNPQLTMAENAALKTLQARTVVNRDPGSELVYVGVGARDPVLAANVTNSLVSLFLEREFKARHDAVMQSSEWLQKQLEDIRGRMQQSAQALANFQKQSGIAPIGDNQNTFSEQMTELNRQLMQAEADRIQLQAYLNRFDGQTSGSLPQISSNPVVQALTQKLAEVRAEITQNLAVYGKNHPVVKKLQSQADELQSQLEAQRSAILKDMRTSYSAAQAREHLMQSQVKDTGKQLTLMTQYLALKKEADANTQLYNNLFGKIKEAGITAESKSSPIRVVDRARVLDSPTRPHRLTNLAAGLFGGIFGGVVLAFLLEGFNTTIRTIEDVRKCFGTGSISIVPQIASGSGVGKLLSPKSRQPLRPVFLLDRPNSPEAEALRSLYTSVRLSQRGSAPQAILVVSPHQGEGKTTMSVNLAIALAERGRTCIVDADLRKEGVVQAFGVESSQGLSEVLTGVISLEEALLPYAEVPNLTILPTGAARQDAAKLVSSSAMAEVIRSLRTEFDFVLIDTCPVLPFADGRVLSALVDGVVLVGRSGMTTRDSLVRALELLEEVHSAPILQIVLNAAEYPSVDYRYYYRYGRGNGSAAS